MPKTLTHNSCDDAKQEQLSILKSLITPSGHALLTPTQILGIIQMGPTADILTTSLQNIQTQAPQLLTDQTVNIIFEAGPLAFAITSLLLSAAKSDPTIASLENLRPCLQILGESVVFRF